MRTEHFIKSDASTAFRKALSQARATGKWMAVAFGVGADGRLTVHRTTYDFPRDLFEEAVRLLKRNLSDELDNLLPDDPLPKAVKLVDCDSRSVGSVRGDGEGSVGDEENCRRCN